MSTKWNISKSDQHSERPMLEQLWYTWSTIGLGPLSAGFRIRAASRGLSDVTSPRVQALDRYLRYILPVGTDPFAITPDMAPVCLSFIETESGERILVYKTYAGKDSVGRPGAFFVHLLSNLPPDFSASQAITLWRSPFLRTSDIDPGSGLQLSGAQLDSLPFDELKQWFSSEIDIMHPKGISSSWMQDCFPLILRAYLMWRRRWEQWKQQTPPIQQRQATPQSEPPRLYIAAPSDMVAAFIQGITRCLPQQLLTDLTFSTYEYDVRSKGQVLLVGTTWAPSSLSDSKKQVNQDLPAACYQEGVAVNCYTYDEVKSQIENDPLAISFAMDATQYLITNNFEELDWLFSEKTTLIPQLDVRGFLQIYDSYIVKAQNPTQRDIELYLDHADVDMLSKRHVQELTLMLSMGNARWLTDFLKPRLKSLFEHRVANAKIAGMLFRLAKATSQKAATAVANDNVATFDVMLSIMSWIADIQSEIWHTLPHILAEQPNIQSFLANYPQIHYRLLQIWSQVIPPISIDDIRPFLTVQEPDFETFYNGDLRPDWKDAMTMAIINSAIAQNAVPLLNQKHQRAISTLLQHRSQTSWYEAADLFEKLIKDEYPDKLYLLSALLGESTSYGKESELLKKARLNNVECEKFLIQYCPSYLVFPQREAGIVEILREFAAKDARRILPVLENWHQSPLLTDWLEAPPNGPANLDKILRAASLKPGESNQFIERYGRYYLELYSQQIPAYRPSSLISGYLKHYLDSFSLKSLWQLSSPARDLFLFLGNSPLLQSLSKEEQLHIQKWHDFCWFLVHPSTGVKDVRIFGKTLQELRIDRDLVLIERLAKAFASCIESETELASVTCMMSTLMTKTELVQMLYAMAEYVRDAMVEPNPQIRQLAHNLLHIHIQFALCFESIYDFSPIDGKQPVLEEQVFIQTLLHFLLHNAHPNTIASLNEKAEQSLLNYWQKWLVYMPDQRNSTSALELQVSSPEYMRHPQAMRPGGHSRNSLDIFLAHCSPRKREIEELCKMLSSRHSLGNWQLVESLAVAFASCIESETELTAVIFSLALRKSLTKAELLQMLYRLAEIIRDDMTNNEKKRIAELRLEPYIIFILCFESACDLLSPDEYALFARTFLNLLLQSADEDIMQYLKNVSRSWPDEILRKWKTFLPQNRRPTMTYPHISRNGPSRLSSTAADSESRSFFTNTASQMGQKPGVSADRRPKPQSWATRLKNSFRFLNGERDDNR